MSSQSRVRISIFLMIMALLVFIVAAFGMSQKHEPFYTWFYCFAWWSYIIFVEAFLFIRGGASLLFSSPAVFFLYLPLSTTVWLIFELFNFRLGNWHYINVPSSLPVRWLGYAVSFATVLPSILATKHLLQHFGFFRNAKCKPLNRPNRLYTPFLLIGATAILLPILYPRFFFPFVWLGFSFLLEPINHHSGGPSLLGDLEKGSPQRIYLLLSAGAVCGLLWEAWNFYAGAKWVYTIPFVGGLKIFEMPLLGFFGFPPFALECFAMISSFMLLKYRLARAPLFVQHLNWALLAFVVIVLDLIVFMGIDSFTAASFAEAPQ